MSGEAASRSDPAGIPAVVAGPVSSKLSLVKCKLNGVKLAEIGRND